MSAASRSLGVSAMAGFAKPSASTPGPKKTAKPLDTSMSLDPEIEANRNKLPADDIMWLPVIEKNIPEFVSANRVGGQRRALLMRMEPGDSVKVPAHIAASWMRLCRDIKNKSGRVYSSRAENELWVRIWRNR